MGSLVIYVIVRHITSVLLASNCGSSLDTYSLTVSSSFTMIPSPFPERSPVKRFGIVIWTVTSQNMY